MSLPAAFSDFSPCMVIATSANVSFLLFQNQSYRMCLWVLPLLGSTNLQSIFPILKESPSHPRGSSHLNPWWKLSIIVSHASYRWSAKNIVCKILPEVSTVYRNSLFAVLLFPIAFLGHFYCLSNSISRLGILGLQIRWLTVLQQGFVSILFCSSIFFNILVPPKCSLLTSRCHSKLVLFTAFNSRWNHICSEQQPFYFKCFQKPLKAVGTLGPCLMQTVSSHPCLPWPPVQSCATHLSRHYLDQQLNRKVSTRHPPSKSTIPKSRLLVEETHCSWTILFVLRNDRCRM